MNWNEHLRYEDGNLFWLKPGGRRTLHKPAGNLDKSGYVRFQLKRKKYLAHRIIWEMHNAKIPNGFEIDHIDRNPSNNSIENLRLATHQQNNRNKCVNGFYWHKASKKWYARIYIGKEIKDLGRYDNIIDARAAYMRARRELFGEFA